MKRWARYVAVSVLALATVAVAQAPPQTIRLSCDTTHLTIRLPEVANYVRVSMREVMLACMGG